jgi:hypothetical protein
VKELRELFVQSESNRVATAKQSELSRQSAVMPTITPRTPARKPSKATSSVVATNGTVTAKAHTEGMDDMRNVVAAGGDVSIGNSTHVVVNNGSVVWPHSLTNGTVTIDVSQLPLGEVQLEVPNAGVTVIVPRGRGVSFETNQAKEYDIHYGDDRYRLEYNRHGNNPLQPGTLGEFKTVVHPKSTHRTVRFLGMKVYESRTEF